MYHADLADFNLKSGQQQQLAAFRWINELTAPVLAISDMPKLWQRKAVILTKRHILQRENKFPYLPRQLFDLHYKR